MSDLIDRQKAKDAIDMALDHIDHVPSWVYDNLLNALNEVPSVKPTHPTPSNTLGTLDCVDRNEAIKNLEQYKDLFSRDDGDRERYVLTRVIKELKAMPSAQPERKKGKWIGYNADDKDWQRDDGSPIFMNCSECHEAVINNGSAHWNFCPNCGLRMGESDSDDL